MEEVTAENVDEVVSKRRSSSPRATRWQAV